MSLTVAALYKFVSLPDHREMREPLQQCCVDNEVIGTLLLADEGINGTIAGPPDGIANVLDFLRADPRLADLTHKESHADEAPFHRMKVKIKKEIVTMGVPGVDPVNQAGSYVKPEDWNALISDPDVVLVDTRNDYEVQIGSFEGAVDPDIESFRDFPAWADEHLDPEKTPKVAMFCTGGIRCEKSTSLLRLRGFEEVYHLQGGILKYLEDVPEDQSLWNGECYVFDQRVSVKHGLELGSYEFCHACRRPLSDADKESESYVPGVSCERCTDEFTDEQKAKFAERERQMEIARQRGEKHLGATLEDSDGS